jgi:Tol biopolymer transport system component
MRPTVLALLFVILVLVTGGTASGQSQRTNGLVSFGSCCGDGTTGIYTIRQDGSGQKLIYTSDFDDAPLISAWSPNGGRIAFVARGGVWTMSATGTQLKQLTKGKGDTLAPSWSPDGKQIVFVDLAARHGTNYSLYVIGSNGRGLKKIVRGARYQNNPAWAPSGKLIMFERANALWTVKPNGRGQKRVTTGTSPSWSPNGKSVAFDRNGDLWTMNANGNRAHLVIEVPSSTAGIAWSPDGHWIAYAIADRGDVMLVHPDGTGEKRLTDDEELFHSEPAWQPRP